MPTTISGTTGINLIQSGVTIASPTITSPSITGTVSGGSTIASPSVSGTLTMTTGGITFNANPGGGTQATLNDYEVGTWTPGLSVAGVSFTSAVGKYTKIGNFVYVTWELNFPSTANTSSFEVTGLPFTVNNNNYVGSVGITNYGSADLAFFAHGSTTNIFVRNYSNSNLQLNAFSSKFVHGSAGYFI